MPQGFSNNTGLAFRPPSWRGKKHNEATKAKIGNSNRGKVRTIEAREKIKIARAKQVVRRGFHLSQEHKDKIRKTLQRNVLPKCFDCGKELRSYKAKRCLRCQSKGERCKFWKGGITPVNTMIRNSLEYKLWRTAVFTRDGYACIWGGSAHGNKLVADHIKPFSLFPELRFALDNGRTLCRECHKKTETFGWKLYHNGRK